MSALADALIDASCKTVAVPLHRPVVRLGPDGAPVLDRDEQPIIDKVEYARLHFRIRPVYSADLLEQGGGFLLMVVKDAKKDGDKEPAKLQPVKAADVVAGVRFRGAVVCAGVVAGSKDGVTWEDLTVVPERARESKAGGRVWIGSLPAEALIILSREILALSGGGVESAERLASFL